MAAAAVPVPGKRERLSRTVNLALQAFPGKRRVRSFLEGDPVLVDLRPAAVHTVVRRGRITAIVQAESFVGLVALSDAHAEEFHHHLAARRPTPHRSLLGMKINRL